MVAPALWDVGVWDESFWDNSPPVWDGVIQSVPELLERKMSMEIVPP